MSPRKRAKRPPRELPTCPSCGQADRVAHYDLFKWFCRCCSVRFTANTTYIDGAPFVTRREVAAGREAAR